MKRIHWLPLLLASVATIPFVVAFTFANDRLIVDSTPSISWSRKNVDESPEALYSRLIQEDWEREDKIDGSFESYQNAVKRHLELANELLDVLSDELDADLVDELTAALAELKTRFDALRASEVGKAETLYAQTRGLKRRIVFANPLYQGYPLLFCKRAPGSYNHLVAQYLGWRARSGGGLYVLEEPGKSLKTRCLTDGKLPLGSFLEPRLSFDGKKILFSYVDLSDGKVYDPVKVHFSDPDEGFYHVYSIDVDGSNLKQLTSGSYDDLMPNWLPDGDVVFSSTRRKGYARCFWWGFGKRWNMFTLHRMKPDGSAIQTLSYHDTSEWFPTATEDGVIAYARWDYIDRDAVSHQNLWSTRPDGTNPKAVWGNATPNPLCVFQARPIPETSKFVFTASAHHSITGGSLAILDPSAGADGLQSIKRITPDVPFPESEGKLSEYYESPYPLSDEFFIVSYSPYPLKMEGEEPNLVNACGVYAYDVFGNRELIYRDESISSVSAIPLRAEKAPVVLASSLPKDAPDYGEMSVENVYEGLGANVKRSEIKKLRIVQIFPKTTRDLPPVGLAGEENARGILGTVPVESDGSAYFRVPARTPILLQALDSEGRAYQTMRSLTYLQPGERVACVGCHEDRDSSAYASSAIGDGTTSVSRSIALTRAPSEITPGELGGRPFSYMETVQPILDAKCVSCHNNERADGGINLLGERGEPGRDIGVYDFVEGTFNLAPNPSDYFSKSYYALCEGRIFYDDDGNDPEKVAKALVPRFGGRNKIQVTEPGGRYGSIGSRLMKLIRDGHEGVRLIDAELRKLNAWIDMNAIFYGVYEPDDQARQFSGERLPMPEIQ